MLGYFKKQIDNGSCSLRPDFFSYANTRPDIFGLVAITLALLLVTFFYNLINIKAPLLVLAPILVLFPPRFVNKLMNSSFRDDYCMELRINSPRIEEKPPKAK